MSSDPLLNKLLARFAETFKKNSTWGKNLVFKLQDLQLEFRKVMCLKIEC